MKKLRILSLILVLILLCSCASDWPGYAGTMEGYEYCHTEERDQAWEEDILFLAETFLTEHPALADVNFQTMIKTDLSGAAEHDYSNAHYDEKLRSSFIDQINQLIRQIPTLSDAQILFEAQRVVASLGDAHSRLDVEDEGAVLPICFEPLFDASGVDIYAVRVPAAHEEVLVGKLTAINDVPIAEILDKLSAYVSHENEYWAIHSLADPHSNTLLTQKTALQVIGVMEADAESAELTFENEGGEARCVMDFVSAEEFREMDCVSHALVTGRSVRFAYNRNYWYEFMEEENVMYVRFWAMRQDPETSLNSFLAQIQSQLRDAETPMRLVIDFRFNTGGDIFTDTMNSFASAVNQYGTDGVYILINGKCSSAGVIVPCLLANAIDGAQLVGTPAGQYPNMLCGARYYELPNCGRAFGVSNEAFYAVPGADETALQPDILVYQSAEDYRENVDTILEYVRSIE